VTRISDRFLLPVLACMLVLIGLLDGLRRIRRCQRGRCMHNPLALAHDALACIDGAFCLCNPV
jgi:hypothetical protein